MWRSAVLALLLATAINGSIWDTRPKKFEVGHSYEFTYEAQVMTGIPKTSWHYTGFKLLAKLNLQVVSFKAVRMTLSNVDFLRVNRELPIAQPTVQLPVEMFQKLHDPAIQETILRELARPVQFAWHLGQVSAFYVDPSEEFWSVNIKRGILNMLNVDMKRNKGEDRPQWNGNFYIHDHEDGIEGKCKSAYHWNKFPYRTPASDREPIAIVMTKTLDPTSCTERPQFDHGMYVMRNCEGKCVNVSRDVVKTETKTTVNATWWPTNSWWGVEEFFAWEIQTNSRYTFAPVHNKMGSISSFVVQNLMFVKETTGVANFVAGSSSLTLLKTLQMEMPLAEINPSKTSTGELNSQLFAIMQQLRTEMTHPNPTVLPLIWQWVQLLRKAPVDQISQLISECRTHAPEHLAVLEILEDILPAVGTVESVKVLVDEFVMKPMAGVEDDARVAAMITTLARFNNLRNPMSVIHLMEAARSPIVRLKRNRAQTLKALFLTIGSTAKTFFDRQHTETSTLTPTMVCNFFMKEMPPKHQQQVDLSEMENLVTLLKAVGNFGSKLCVPHLQTLIYTSGLPTSVRVQAIYSLRKLANSEPLLLQRLLLPVFFDTVMDVELRLAAFIVAMKTHPERVVLDSIVHHVNLNEPVEQVRSYVVEYMTTVSRHAGCGREFSKNISKVLETMPTDKPSGFQYSQSYQLPVGRSKFSVMSNVIWTTNGFLPRTANIRLQSEMSNKKMDLMEAGFRMEGAQQLLDKLLGPSGSVYKTKTLKDLIKEVESSDVGDTDFSIYLKMFDNEIGYWSADKNIIDTIRSGMIGMKKDWINFLLQSKPLPIEFQRTFYTDGLLRIPTTFGFPLTVNFTSVVHADVRGKVSIPRSFFDPTETVIKAQMNPKLFTRHRMDVGIDGTLVRSFSSINVSAHVPDVSKMEVDIVYRKGDMKLFFRRPMDTWNPISLASILQNHLHECRAEKCQQETFIMPTKYEDRRQVSNPMRTLPMKTWEYHSAIAGMKLRAEYAITPRHLVKIPTHFLMSGSYQVDLRVENKEMGADGLMLQWQAACSDMEEDTDSRMRSFEQCPLRMSLWSANMPKPQQNVNGSTEILRFIFTWMPQETHSYRYEAVFEMLPVFGMEQLKYVGKGQLFVPEVGRFDRTKPLQVLTGNSEKNIIFIVNVTDGINQQQMMSYAMSLGMDEDARQFMAAISADPESYAALHPFLHWCAQDLKSGMGNSLACFHAWRFMNIFNQMNFTVSLTDKVVTSMKPVMERILAYQQHLLNRQWTGVSFSTETGPSSGKSTTYKTSFITSPYDTQGMTMQMFRNGLKSTFSHLLASRFCPKYLLPTEPFIPGVMRIISNDHYPAVCSLRFSPELQGQVMTFDGVMYNMPKKWWGSLEVHCRRAIIVQDVQNRIQVSAIKVGHTFVIQTRFQVGPVVNVIFKHNEDVSVSVDGETVKLPYTKKDENNNVVVMVQINQKDILGVPGVVAVQFPLMGVGIKTDGRSILDVALSPFFHAETRGLCGDFNGEVGNDLKDPTCQKVYVNPSEFLKSEYSILSKRTSGSIEEVLHDPEMTSWLPMQACKPEYRPQLRSKMNMEEQ